MSTGHNHLLQKVIFEINLAKQDGAFEIQSRISNLFRSQILGELEKRFNEVSTEGLVLTIDKIEIDLGNLSSSRLEEDLSAAFQREMNEFLATVNEEVGRYETTTFTKSQKLNVRWSVPGNSHFEAEVTLSPDFVSQYERVLQLLEFGVLPESGNTIGPEKIAALINSVFEHQPEQLAKFIRANGPNKPHILQRLAMNLTQEQLQYITALVGCPYSGELLTLVNDLEKFLKSRKIEISEISIPGSVRLATLSQFIWWLILVKFTGADSSGTITASPVKLVTEILFLIDRLSERSVFSGKGSALKLQGLSQVVVEGTEAARALRKSGKKSANHDGEMVEFPRDSGHTIFNSPTSLLHNSLFTLPEKLDVTRALTGIDDNVPGAESGIYIGNAGLIILAPYLKPFFSRLGLLDGKNFVSREAAWKAVHLLQHACGYAQSDQDGWSEQELIFNKILCGINIAEPVPERLELSSVEREELNGLLNSVLQNWTIMQRSSVFALQSTFLQKKGRLTLNGRNWDLLVERDSAVEILIDKLPWSISIIKLPWNGYSINTQW